MTSVWRILKEKYAGASFSGDSAALYPGRWNSDGVKMVYTAGSLSLSALELFVHLQNDGLGINARNIGTLLITNNVYLVPFGQDNPKMKPNSLVAHMDRIPETILAACIGRQIQPVLLDYR